MSDLIQRLDAAPVVVCPSAFSLEGARALSVPPGTTLAEIVRLALREDALPWALIDQIVVEIEGTDIDRRLWPRVRPKEGAKVLVGIRLAGDNNTKGILGLVALIGIGLAAGPLAAGLGFTTAAGTLTATGKIVAAGITLAGSLAISFLFRPPIAEGGRATAPSQSYLISGATNQPRYFQPVPRIFGRRKIVPALAAVPLVYPRGDTSRLVLLLDCGYGPLSITEPRLGEQDLDLINRDENVVRMRVHENFTAGDRLVFYRRDVDLTGLDAELENTSWQTFQSTTDAVGISLDIAFPRGLFRVDGSSQKPTRQRIRVQWRRGGGAWKDAAGAAELSPASYGGAEGTAINITGFSASPIVVGITWDVPAGKDPVEVRVQALDPGNTTRLFNQAVWTALKTIQDVAPIAPRTPRTVIELRIDGSEELSNNVEQFSCVAQSKLRAFNAQGPIGDRRGSRSVAEAFVEAATGSANPRPLPNRKIDWPQLKRWDRWCERTFTYRGRKVVRHQIDAIFDTETTVWRTLEAIAGIGRAVPVLDRGLLSVRYDDEANTEPVQLITPRNALSFTAERVYIDQPHAIRCRYVSLDDWEEKEITVYNDGYSEFGLRRGTEPATLVEELDIFGVSDPAVIYRDVRYQMAQAKLRPETYTIDMDIEHLVSLRGDPVRIAFDDALIGGMAARIVAADFNGTDTIMDLEAPVVVAPGYVVELRSPSLQVTRARIVRAPSSRRIAVLGFFPAQEDDMAVIGEDGRTTRDCLITAIRPQGSDTATLTLVDLAPAIHRSDTEPIPDYDANVSAIPGGRPQPPVGLNARQSIYYEGRNPFAQINLVWAPGPGQRAAAYAIYVRESDQSKFEFLGTTSERRYEARRRWRLNDFGDRFVSLRPGGFVGERLRFKVQALGINGETFPIARAPTATIDLVADTNRPDPVPRLSSDMRGRSMFLTWEPSPFAGLGGYQLRYSPTETNWWKMVPIARFVTHDTLQLEVPARSGIYAIKPISTSGVRSWAATYTQMTIDWIDDWETRITLEAPTAFNTWPGLRDGVYPSSSFGPQGLRLANNGVDLGGAAEFPSPAQLLAPTAVAVPVFNATTQPAAPRPAGADPAAPYPATISPITTEKGAVFRDLGFYQFDRIVDLGSVLEPVRLVAEIDAYGVENTLSGVIEDSDLWDARIEVQTVGRLPFVADWAALDDGTGLIPVDYDKDGNIDERLAALWDPTFTDWTEWRPITVTDVRGRIFRFRLVLESFDPRVTPVVTRAAVTVDMPARTERYTNRPVPASGLDLVFRNAFYERPAIGVALENAAVGDTYEVRNLSRTGVRIEIRNAAGNLTAGTVELIVLGYGRVQ